MTTDATATPTMHSAPPLTIEIVGVNCPPAAPERRVTAFTIFGLGAPLHVHCHGRSAHINTQNTAATVFLKYLEPIPSPRRLTVHLRDPYRFDFVPMTLDEQRTAQRHRQYMILGVLALLVPIVLAIVSQQS